MLALAGGLVTAVPSHAAGVTLPAGCTTQGTPASSAAVTYLTCTDLTSSADLARYTSLRSLEIGHPDYSKPAANLTRIPKLPSTITYLSIRADKVTDFTALSGLRKLEHLTVWGSTVTDLASVAANKDLVSLELQGPGYWGADLSPLAKLSKLEELLVWCGQTKKVMADEGSWYTAGFGRGLDGKYMMPENNDIVDVNGKPTGEKGYNFSSATGRIKYNTATIRLQSVKSTTVPKIASMPRLSSYNVWLSRPLNVAALADWAHEKDDKLVVSGTRKVGSTLTVRHKLGGNHADTFQWKRDGNPISGATGKTYKLRSADLGHKITVTGTDSQGSGAFAGMFRYIPYSQTAWVTSKL